MFKKTLLLVTSTLLMSSIAGAAGAVFLYSLTLFTKTFTSYPNLIWLLPFYGLLSGIFYYSKLGNKQHSISDIVEELSDGLSEESHRKNLNNINPNTTLTKSIVIQKRLAPSIVVFTLFSHLFGASVGREGTAVQMGASIGSAISRLKLIKNIFSHEVFIRIGMSSGFGAVFGSPLAGALFSIEITKINFLKNIKLLPLTLIASYFGYIVRTALYSPESAYPYLKINLLQGSNIRGALIAGLMFGLCAILFSICTSFVKKISKLFHSPLQPAIGGLIILILTKSLNHIRYNGIGTDFIQESFYLKISQWDWLGKIIFTTTSSGFGIKGGEVTPLMYIGSTFGNSMAPILHLPTEYLAALGLVSVFAACANVPLTCTLMAVEFFGFSIFPFALLSTLISAQIGKKYGIYRK